MVLLHRTTATDFPFTVRTVIINIKVFHIYMLTIIPSLLFLGFLQKKMYEYCGVFIEYLVMIINVYLERLNE